MKSLTCPVCNRPATTLYHVSGHPGEYCFNCRPTVRPRRDPYIESVNGTIIGPMLTRYEFWTKDNAHRIVTICAESDDKAITEFRQQYADHWAAGARMRVFD